jgi:hypothetical protein
MREKLKAERERLAVITDLKTGHKEALSDMLLTAYEASNGTPDKLHALAEAVSAQAICMSRDAIHRKEDFAEVLREALDGHRDACILAAKVSPSGLSAKVAAWVAAIRPVAWPTALVLGVACLSPYVGPGLLAFVERICK